jgi:hypothetical protein
MTAVLKASEPGLDPVQRVLSRSGGQRAQLAARAWP